MEEGLVTLSVPVRITSRKYVMKMTKMMIMTMMMLLMMTMMLMTPAQGKEDVLLLMQCCENFNVARLRNCNKVINGIFWTARLHNAIFGQEPTFSLLLLTLQPASR